MQLLNYWPEYARNLVEFQQIAHGLQPEFETAAQTVRDAPDDFFLVSLTEYGCGRWESILGLVAAPGDTLEERRERILVKYLDRLPYTFRMLLRYLATISEDFEARLDLEAYRLYVQIRLSGLGQRDALVAVLGQMLPANMVLKTQARIPQRVGRPACVVAAAMTTINRHTHRPQGG